MTNLLIPDLVPDTQYAIEVRAVRTNGVSEWSNRALFTTVSDTVLPLTPVNITWVVSGDSFGASWDTTSLNVNNEVINIVRYEIELTANSLTRILSVPQTTGSEVYFNLMFEDNRSLFNSPQPTIGFRVRAVSNIDTKSAWSVLVSASNPVPDAATSITAVAGPNQVALSWTPPSDVDIIGYNIYLGAVKLTFINSTSWIYYTSGYISTVLIVKTVDKFNQESTGASSNSVTPISPSVIDTTAPDTPTSLAVTITNNTNGIGSVVATSWVMNSPPSDLAGYYIRYRKVGDTNYSTTPFTKDVLAGTIELQSAYTNYEFQIKAYDWSSNESAWSATVTATSPANTAPSNVTGLAAVAGNDTITYTWNAVADTDIKNYEVTFSTSSTFISDNITYLTGEATMLTVSGLYPDTFYYARVRAVDTFAAVSVAWSSTVSTSTGAYPVSPASDTYAPQSSPTPSVMGGLSNLYVTWPATTLNSNGGAQNDAVTYEVHLSTSTGFTPSGATKVTEVMGTSAYIDILPGTTTPLSYGTTYFIKLVAKDRDGSAAAGTQGSGTISKVASGDVTSIGADLIVPGTGIINNLIINTGGGIQSANYSAGTAGYRLDLAGLEINNGSIKASLLTAGTLTSSTGVIQIGAGASLVMNGGYLRSNTYTYPGQSGGTYVYNSGATAGFYLGNDGLVIAQGTIKAEAFAGGSFTAGTISMGAGGSITGGSWTLNSSGLTIPNGAISAAALNIQVGNNLMPAKYVDFEAVSTAYPAFPTVLGISSSTTSAISNTQKFINVQSANFGNTSGGTRGWLFGASQTDYNIPVNPSTRYIVSGYLYNASGAIVSGYFGIKQQDGTYVNGASTTFANTAGWVRYSGVVTTTSAASAAVATFTVTANGTFYVDAVQVEQAINATVTTPSSWSPPGATLVDGGMIRTGSVQSNATGFVWDSGTSTYIAGTQPAWVINTSGAATFANLNVMGSLIVGDPTDVTHSGKYVAGSAFYEPGVSGWIMHGDGWVEFNQITAASIDGQAIKVGTLSGAALGDGDMTAAITVIGTGGFAMGNNGAGTGTPAIKLNPIDGLVIDPPGSALITVPVNGDPVSLRNVSLTATDATFNGNVSILGTTNYIGGDVTLEKFVSNPSVAPTVVDGWSDPSTFLQASIPGGWAYWGLCEGTTGNYLSNLWAPNDARMWLINKTTGATSEFKAINPTIPRTGLTYEPATAVDAVAGVFNISIGGTAHLGTLVRKAAWSYHQDGYWITREYPPIWVPPVDYSYAAQWYITIFRASDGVQAYQWTWDGAITYPSVYSDGTYVYIGGFYSGGLFVNRYAYDGAGATAVASSSGAVTTDADGGMYWGSADFGSPKVIINTYNSMYGLNQSMGSALQSITWPHAQGLLTTGLHWDGTKFLTLTNGGKIYKHSTNTAAAVSKTFSYAWYDSKTAGTTNPTLGNGKHRTMPSPNTSYTIQPRGWFKVSSPTIPVGAGNDDVDSIKIIINSVCQPDITVGSNSALYGTWTTSSSEPVPVANEFAALSSPGRLVSAATDGTNPYIQLKGDGSGRVGPLSWDSSGKDLDTFKYFSGTESPLVGTGPPVGTRKIWKADTVVVTVSGSGTFDFNYGSGAFPNGVISVVAVPGDNTANFTAVRLLPAYMTLGHVAGYAMTGDNNATVASGSGIRINYMACGW